MTADEFLKQIKTYDTLIDCRCAELQSLWDLATKITTTTDKEVVQTSGVADKVGEIVAKIIDLQAEINDTVDEYIDIRNECIRIIEQIMDKPVEYAVIHKHYVQYKTFVEIEQEEGYSYQGIMKIKERALKRVDAILREKYAETRKCI